MIWGLIILYMFSAVGLLMASNKHGKPQTGKHSFWSTLLGNIIQFVLLWWALGWRFG